MSTVKTIRCAIYTRKSSDEGLDQEFNTLEAQREACEAYIKSQAHEGWRALPERFDDGGHSGGTLERPAMKRLLDRVRERRIDIILIYKIDRLTRSLTDFAKLAEQFDQYGVSFVSVTQQFNTTTSMGRLMLNVLLSFAQFEREIAGERIRDKIAASKKKGMWMGGSVPLGYDWKDKKLVINEAEAKTVHMLFELYLKFGNVRLVVTEAARRGLRTKMRPTAKGQRVGGHEFRRGHIYAILRNPLYVGRVPHKDKSYAADHKPIVNEKIWQATQSRLDQNLQGAARAFKRIKDEASLLVGLLYDEQGNRFTPSHTMKGNRRYRYYVENALVTGETEGKGRLRRIPASEIERAVKQALADFLKSPPELLKALGAQSKIDDLSEAHRKAVITGEQLLGTMTEASLAICTRLLTRVTVGTRNLKIQLAKDELHKLCGLSNRTSKNKGLHQIQVPTRFGNRGGQRKLIMIQKGLEGRADPALIKALAQAHHWWELLTSGSITSLNQIARRENKAGSYIGRVIRLAFMAPDLQQAILNGQHPPELTAKRVILRENLDLRWSAQALRFMPHC